MPKLQFYLLDLRQTELNNKQAVLLFGRTSNNQRVCIIDTSFLPYFYVIPKKGVNLQGKLEKLELERDGKISKVIKTESLTKNFFGRDIEAIKVYVPFFSDIREIVSVIGEWEIIEGIYEHDIPFLRNYLADKGFLITSLLEADAEPVNLSFKVDTFLAKEISMNPDEIIKSPRMLAFDIETYNPEGRKIDMKNNAIIMLSFYGENFRKVFTWKRFKTDLDYIEFVNSESDIIEKFVETVDQYAPDILIGYNSDIFDFPYIDERAKKYKISPDISLDNSSFRLAKGENMVARIPGIIHIDILKYIRKAITISGNYSLDNISRKILGKNKKEVEIGSLYKVWDEGNEKIQQFCEYNLIDSELAYELTKKFLPNIIELSRITGLTIDNITRLGYSQIVESFLFRQAHSFNELIPRKPDKTEIAKRFLESYKGSFVFEPKPGIYENIFVFDFRSLYPTIIVSHNISPDTINCDCCDDKTNISPDEGTPNHFCKNKKGFLPLILEDLITRRVRIKELQSDNLFLNARADNLKILANSFYGYLGFYGARWYSIDAARSITSWGRYYIQQVIDAVEKEGFSVIYSDTDSIFITLNGKNEGDVAGLLEKINSVLPGLMELEYEGHYKRGLFVSAKEKAAGAKKKYALLSDKDAIKIRGFESIRKNWSPIGREVQKTVLESVLKTGKIDYSLTYLKEIIEKLRKHEVLNKDTIIETTLQKDLEKYDSLSPHVSVAMKMKEKNIDVSPGMKIEYIITEGEGKIHEKAKLPEDVGQGKYDSEYYINNQVIPAVEKIFELFSVNVNELIKEEEQKGLGEF